MIDHVSVKVSDYNASREFFEKVLAPLGFELVMEFGGEAAGFGRDGQAQFWVVDGEAGGPIHIAFKAPDRFAVDAFHKAAIESGATDNGGPGLREHYHENYYAAFVLDNDGNNVEAVCHVPA